MSISASEVKASFAGISFGVIQTEGAAIAAPGSERNYAITDVNYGSDTYIQSLGVKSVEETYDCVVPLANWAALQAKQDTVGTLTIASGYSRTAYMGNIGRQFIHTTNDYVHVSITWVVR